MGKYLNPGNEAFAEIIEGNYIDKTGLIDLINNSINKPEKLMCLSRPRRFGKSYTAQMLCAYYDCSCDSHFLFDQYKISKAESYRKHLNQYNVIVIDVTGFISTVKQSDGMLKLSGVPGMIAKDLRNDLIEVYPELSRFITVENCLLQFVEKSGKKIVFIIDEWDALIREAKDDHKTQEAYLNLLRGLFKNANVTPKVVAAAYMTGILPIKKDGSQSAISNFREYSMIKPRKFGEYVGFTEEEVRKLCDENNISFDSMKQWYDGYDFKDVGAVYNPNSVMQAIDNGDFDSYWTETSAAEGLMEYISKPYNGLSKTIAELIGGVDVTVNTNGFANDLVTFKGKDDVLTLMIHLGYLAYNSESKTVYIPNEEIKLEFQKSIREVNHKETLKRLEESEKLFIDTIHGNEEAVARQIEKIHGEETAPLHYNKEESLRSVIKLAYYTYRDHYLQWEELPVGEGYADVVYLPKHNSD